MNTIKQQVEIYLTKSKKDSNQQKHTKSTMVLIYLVEILIGKGDDIITKS